MIRPQNLLRSLRPTLRGRNGLAAVEAAVVLTIFLLLTMCLLEFGIALLNRNTLTIAAQRPARAAIVRGEKAANQAGSWGPQALSQWANSGSESANVIAPLCTLMAPPKVQIHMEWPDGDIQLGDRVRVRLTYKQPLMVARLLGASTWELTGTSTMCIQH